MRSLLMQALKVMNTIKSGPIVMTMWFKELLLWQCISKNCWFVVRIICHGLMLCGRGKAASNCCYRHSWAVLAPSSSCTCVHCHFLTSFLKKISILSPCLKMVSWRTYLSFKKGIVTCSWGLVHNMYLWLWTNLVALSWIPHGTSLVWSIYKATLDDGGCTGTIRTNCTDSWIEL